MQENERSRKRVQSIYLHNKPEQCPFDLNTTHNTWHEIYFEKVGNFTEKSVQFRFRIHVIRNYFIEVFLSVWIWTKNVSKGVNSVGCWNVFSFQYFSLFSLFFIHSSIHSCKHQRKLYCDIFLPVFDRFSRTVFFSHLRLPCINTIAVTYFFFRCFSATLFIDDDDDDDDGVVAALNASSTRDVVPNQLFTNWASIYATLKFACRKW